MKPQNATVKTDPRWTLAYSNGAQRRKLGRCAIVTARFGSCRVIKSFPGKGGRTYLQCGCGTEFDVTTRQVWRGQVTRCASCGHAESNRKTAQNQGIDVIPDPKLRSLWLHRRTGMISRCYNPKSKAYKNYGGRGITVYGPWIENRIEWLKYVVTLPNWDDLSLEIDRENNDGNYEPGNLRMVTRKVNCNNRRIARKSS